MPFNLYGNNNMISDVTETERGQQGIGEHTTEAVKSTLRVLVRGLNSVLS